MPGGSSHVGHGKIGSLFGVYPAVVDDLEDPLAHGRIKVKLPWYDDQVTAWATIVSPYADDDQGVQILPEIGSLVIVAFEAGNPSRPYVLGAAWNGTTALPRPAENANNFRMIKSRAGSRLEFDDTEGSPKVSITAGTSGHTIVMDQGANEIKIEHSNGSVIRMNASGGIEITANTKVTVSAPMVDVSAPMSQFSGVVKCDTLIATTVVGSTYTPGAGNIW